MRRPFDVIGRMANREGWGRFCSPSCLAEWRWANEPETFPQSERRGEVVTYACASTTRYRLRPVAEKDQFRARARPTARGPGFGRPPLYARCPP